VTDNSDTNAVIAFTDIAGFTQFTAARGDAEALALLDLQTAIVRSALPDRARIVKELGDGLMLWFAEAGPAVRTGLDLLHRFTEAARDDTPLWVRMGMHWGTPRPRGDDFVGHDVNVAARIADAAGPGELLVSAETCDALGAPHPDVRLEELGPVVMKGLPEPVRLFRASRSTP
jgi:adenylate cyclase